MLERSAVAGRLAAVVPGVAGAPAVPVAVVPVGGRVVAMLPEAGGFAAVVPVVAGRLVEAVDRSLRSYFHSTALNGSATSFSPIPRKPPTPTTIASALPLRSIRTSLTSPIFSLFWP